jgi:hypothetical protein
MGRHFSALYDTYKYTVTVNELKAALKVSPHTGQSGAVNKTSVESMAKDENSRKQKDARGISLNTSQTAKN